MSTGGAARYAGEPSRSSRPSRRLLVWHAGVVAAATAAAVGATALGWVSAASALEQVIALLGLPVLMPFGASSYYPRGITSAEVDVLVQAVPALFVLLAHASIRSAIQRRRSLDARGGDEDAVADSAPRVPPAASWTATGLLSAVVGAAAWVGWLSGWVPWYSVPAAYGGDVADGPYTVAQHVGYVATLAAAALLLSSVLDPLAVAVGLTIGFWVCWTAWVAQQDSAFWAVSSMLVLVDVALPVVVSALLGYGLRRRPAPSHVQRRRHG